VIFLSLFRIFQREYLQICYRDLFTNPRQLIAHFPISIDTIYTSSSNNERIIQSINLYMDITAKRTVTANSVPSPTLTATSSNYFFFIPTPRNEKCNRRNISGKADNLLLPKTTLFNELWMSFPHNIKWNKIHDFQFHLEI
jgi:hypothetical protein